MQIVLECVGSCNPDYLNDQIRTNGSICFHQVAIGKLICRDDALRSSIKRGHNGMRLLYVVKAIGQRKMLPNETLVCQILCILSAPSRRPSTIDDGKHKNVF